MTTLLMIPITILYQRYGHILSRILYRWKFYFTRSPQFKRYTITVYIKNVPSSRSAASVFFLLLQARLCRPLPCFCHPFADFVICLDSNHLSWPINSLSSHPSLSVAHHQIFVFRILAMTRRWPAWRASTETWWQPAAGQFLPRSSMSICSSLLKTKNYL